MLLVLSHLLCNTEHSGEISRPQHALKGFLKDIFTFENSAYDALSSRLGQDKANKILAAKAIWKIVKGDRIPSSDITEGFPEFQTEEPHKYFSLLEDFAQKTPLSCPQGPLGHHLGSDFPAELEIWVSKSQRKQLPKRPAVPF